MARWLKTSFTAFKSIDDTLWKDAGCSSELDYIEQTSWVIFLKYLDDYENEKATAALLNGEIYTPIIDFASQNRQDGWVDWFSVINNYFTIDTLKQ